MARRMGKSNGFVTIDCVVVKGETFWHASFTKEEPPTTGGYWADKVLVDTASRAGKSRETCEAKAKELVERMGYPNAEFRYSAVAAEWIEACESELGLKP